MTKLISERQLSHNINKHRNVFALWRIKGFFTPDKVTHTVTGKPRYWYSEERMKGLLKRIGLI